MECCLDLDRPLDKAHLIVVADAALPCEALVGRESRDARVNHRLEGLILTGCVPVLLRAYHEQVDVRFPDLSSSDAHTSALPEALCVTQSIFAQVDSIEHFFLGRELSDRLEAPLAQERTALLRDQLTTMIA